MLVRGSIEDELERWVETMNMQAIFKISDFILRRMKTEEGYDLICFSKTILASQEKTLVG